MEANDSKIFTIGIIGGGKIGSDLLKLFSQSKFSKVRYVVDRDNKAPAIIEAKNVHVETFDDIDKALKIETDLILEVTGSDKVVDILVEKIGGASGKLITHVMAYVLLQVIQENNKKLSDSVISETQEIKKNIDDNLNQTSKLIDHIENVTSEMRMLALNARIEAARVGEAGRGFSLVAEQMSKLTDSVRDVAKQMEKINLSVKSTSDKINVTIGRLGD